MRKMAVLSRTLIPVSTKSPSVIKPTIGLKPTTSSIETARRMRKGTVPIATKLSLLTSQSTAFGTLLVVFFFFQCDCFIPPPFTVMCMWICVVVIVVSTLIPLSCMNSRIFKDSARQVIVTFLTKQLCLFLSRMFQKGRNRFGGGPTIHYPHGPIISSWIFAIALAMQRVVARRNGHFLPTMVARAVVVKGNLTRHCFLSSRRRRRRNFSLDKN